MWTQVLFRCLYCITRFITPDKLPYFNCFMYSLINLLPSEEARRRFNMFLSVNDMSKIVDTKELFKFIYILNKYTVDYSIQTLDVMENLYAPSKITKDFWGPPTWATIHLSSLSYPNRYDEVQSKSFKAMMVCLQYILPCSICRNHLAENLKEDNIDMYFQDRDDLFKWTVSLHNRVNKQLGKRIVPLEEAIQIYTFSY